jgi:hypothetical protein
VSADDATPRAVLRGTGAMKAVAQASPERSTNATGRLISLPTSTCKDGTICAESLLCCSVVPALERMPASSPGPLWGCGAGRVRAGSPMTPSTALSINTPIFAGSAEELKDRPFAHCRLGIPRGGRPETGLAWCGYRWCLTIPGRPVWQHACIRSVVHTEHQPRLIRPAEILPFLPSEVITGSPNWRDCSGAPNVQVHAVGGEGPNSLYSYDRIGAPIFCHTGPTAPLGTCGPGVGVP